MADFTNSNVRRSDGASARGFVLLLVAIIALVFIVAMFGQPTQVDPGASATSSTSETAPAADATSVPVATGN